MNGLILFRVGALVLILFGLVHAGAWLQKPQAEDDIERQMLALMMTHQMDLMGSLRTMYDVYLGFNIALTVAMVTLGIINLLVERRLRHERRTLRHLALVNVAWLAVMLGVSLAYWFAAPSVFLMVAMVSFALSWYGLRRLAKT